MVESARSDVHETIDCTALLRSRDVENLLREGDSHALGRDASMDALLKSEANRAGDGSDNRQPHHVLRIDRFGQVVVEARGLRLRAVLGPAPAGHGDPAPVAVPSGLSTGKVAMGIKRAPAGRGPELTSEQPGAIDSTLHLREHVGRIHVTYDASNVQFAYVDSHNLEFSERRGTRYIHSNYMGWINYLASDLATNLATNLKLSAHDPT